MLFLMKSFSSTLKFLVMVIYPISVTVAALGLLVVDPTPKETYMVYAEVFLAGFVGYVGIFLVIFRS